MPDQKNPAYEEKPAVLGGQDTEFETPEVVVSALCHLEKVLSSGTVLEKGTQEHKQAVDAYRTLLDAIVDRFGEVANMKYATGYYAAPHMLGQVIATTDAQARSPFLNQLCCIRHLVETDFSALPDRFISIDAKFRPEQPLEPLVSEVIRLTADDMPTDEDKAAFDRLVALDGKGWTPCRPRPVQYIRADPEPLEDFHVRKEAQIADLSGMLGADHPIVEDLRQEVANYDETIHAMRVRAKELAATKRDDLPAEGLTL